jgi:peptide chain release factor 2
MAAPDFWNTPDGARRVIGDRKIRKQKVDMWDSISQRVNDAASLVEMAAEEGDDSTFAELTAEVPDIEKAVHTAELTTLLSGEYDTCNAILSIHAGAGGTESQDWVDILLRMYLRWAEDKKFKPQILDQMPGEEAGTKSVVVLIEAPNAYGFLRAERGIHRLVRISPFDANKRRHTSFAAVDVLPEIDDDSEIDINPDDLKIDTYRASGAGGQHVNKTSSAVRITHMPTGIVVQCQNERSQHKNKDMAMKILKSRIFERRRQEQEAKVSKIKGEMKDIAWGSQIRSYVFQPYTMVKDLRTREETGNINAVMNGEIDQFIWAYLEREAAIKSGRIADVKPEEPEDLP